MYQSEPKIKLSKANIDKAIEERGIVLLDYQRDLANQEYIIKDKNKNKYKMQVADERRIILKAIIKNKEKLLYLGADIFKCFGIIDKMAWI